MDMRVWACTVGAVAAKKVVAGRHAVVGEVVREVAIAVSCTSACLKKSLADGNLLRVMGEMASWAEST